MNAEQILSKEHFDVEDIKYLLNCKGEERTILFARSSEIKKRYVENKVYFRGLIEMSNVCAKDCFYCGIRKSNKNLIRFNLSDDEILQAAKFAYEKNYGSIVIQSGEIQSKSFSERIVRLLSDINKLSNGKLRVTLSCGEQNYQTYKRWNEAGAHRYLLRIETSNKELYKRLHPEDGNHLYEKRLECIYALKEIGYQLGTGVMVGLPFQTIEDLANDLIWMRDIDVDMVGLGPYLEHPETPLYEFRHLLLSKEERLDLSFKMIAILRIMMKDINIAATTAMQAIDPIGREKALKIAANVIMPNITPAKYRDKYKLYDDKPCIDENPEECQSCLEARIAMSGNEIAYGEWGDSNHWRKKIK